MITEGALTGFKSWKRIASMRFAPITGLFGTNSSGKTSILQWLLLLKQTAESSDRLQVLNLGDPRDERDLVELGAFQDVVHGHVQPGRLSWELAWTLPEPLRVEDPEGKPGSVLFQDDKLSFSSEIRGEQGGRIKVARMTYSFAGVQFHYRETGSKGEYELTAEGTKAFHFVRPRGRPWPLPAPVKCYGFPDQVSSYFKNAGFLADLQLAFEQLCGRVYYLGPLREYPQRQYPWAGGQPVDVGRRGERAIHAILAAGQSGETIPRGRGKPRFTVEEYAAYWLKELKLIHDFAVRPVAEGSNLYQVHLQKEEGATEVLITDVGFGISQILPVIVLCYYVPKGATVILEQPEIHLHPSVQAGLADVFIDAIKVRQIQILLESHSEHLLRRLQRRIAEQAEEFNANDIALYFCDYQGGESVLLPLDVDPLGNIRNWPEDFFGNEMGEIAAMTRAQLERRRAPA